MGLGKTFVGSEKMIQLGKNVNLLICQKSKIDDWVKHFKEHYATHDHDYCCEELIFDLSDKKQFERFMIESKSATEQNFITDEWTGQSYQQENLYPFYIVGVINYELAWRRKDLLQLEDFTLMLDESSKIQNMTAKQTKFIMKLNPTNVILLSGTPTAGRYENLYSQIELLGWNISEKVYNATYVNWKKIDTDGFIHKIVDKAGPYKNVERLKRKLREHGAVFLKTDECFELPEQTFTTIHIKTTKIYKKFMKNRLVTVDLNGLCEFKDDSDYYGVDTNPRIELVGDTILTQRLYARQLCGHYNQEKLDAFRDLVESTNDRLIVFYNFNAELEALKRIVGERPTSEVNGHLKDLTAYETEDNSITFIQYQAGSMGLNLQKANKIVYFTLTDKCELWMQSHKRIHRIGQDKPCFYYLMICTNSVEEDILKALERGVDFTDDLFEKGSDHE